MKNNIINRCILHCGFVYKKYFDFSWSFLSTIVFFSILLVKGLVKPYPDLITRTLWYWTSWSYNCVKVDSIARVHLYPTSKIYATIYNAGCYFNAMQSKQSLFSDQLSELPSFLPYSLKAKPSQWKHCKINISSGWFSWRWQVDTVYFVNISKGLCTVVTAALVYHFYSSCNNISGKNIQKIFCYLVTLVDISIWHLAV